MKILFISHDANRTGASILAVGIFNYFKNIFNVDANIKFLGDGPLKLLVSPDCILDVRKYHAKPVHLFKRIINKILGYHYYPTSQAEAKIKYYKKQGFTHYYGNSVLSLPELVEIHASIPDARFIVHIHELDSHNKDFVDELSYANQHSFVFIAASKLVQQNLIEQYGIVPGNIHIVYEFINVEIITEKSKLLRDKTVSESGFVVSGSGYASQRKGFDFFVELSHTFKNRFPDLPVYFRWVGKVSEKLMNIVHEQAEKNEQEANLILTGEMENPYPFYNQSSVFVLTSREDPFPLVVLEHALLGKPVICFDKGTGSSEFVMEYDAGMVIPYFEMDAVVNAISQLYHNQELYHHYAANAKAAAQHFDIGIMCDKIRNIVEHA